MPDPQPGMHPPGSQEKILHSCLQIGDTAVMASDGECGGKPSFQGFSLALTVKDEAEADRVFNALGQGGKVQMPLTKTFFSSPSACSRTSSALAGWSWWTTDPPYASIN